MTLKVSVLGSVRVMVFLIIISKRRGIFHMRMCAQDLSQPFILFASGFVLQGGM
jgi:hypothetical protein